MKAMTRLITRTMIILLAGASVSYGPKIDEDRMQRDIAVGENVLGTLIKQEFNNERSFFPLEINGAYQVGYGVTFMLPGDYTAQMLFTIAGTERVYISGGQSFNVSNGNHEIE